MVRTGVTSSTIISVGYEAATSILELELFSGEIIQYFNVPLSVYIAFMNAGSKGDYYQHNIKSVFEGKQVTEVIKNE